MAFFLDKKSYLRVYKEELCLGEKGVSLKELQKNRFVRASYEKTFISLRSRFAYVEPLRDFTCTFSSSIEFLNDHFLSLAPWPLLNQAFGKKDLTEYYTFLKEMRTPSQTKILLAEQL